MISTLMKADNFTKHGLVFILATLAGACSHQQIPLQTLFSANDCGIETKALRLIADAAELEAMLKSLPKSFPPASSVVPEVNFENSNLILYALGRKSSGGYSIELYQSDAVLKNRKLYLPVRVKQPKSGNNQIQIVTSPCSIYSLPDTDFSEIIIEDNR